ncbi:carbohydrate porin [Luteibacter sp. 3190]|uniref:carbohydrate porin n=1 Tax=Luteibacter sp. 3190 TaxID=2817736 RepID=UPI0028653448|nr:carbohydrate porin [Luteibacter sp. 3190]MDR6936964.1 porin [Luteibacter sp. 3190]
MRHSFIRHPLAKTVLACLALGATAAHAQDDSMKSDTSEMASSKYLFGDWGGERTRLADKGITFDFGYGFEAAHNYSGGDRRITRYTDQWKFGSAFDLEKLWGWSGATFKIVITDRNGRNIGADANIGTNQLIQEVYGRGQTWHLTIFSLEQKFFDDRLTWKVGRLPVGEDINQFSCDFQNLNFCGAQPGNIVGDYWVNWPTSQWATVLKLDTTKDTFVQIAAYQMNPKYVDDRYARRNGWKPNFPSGTTGALIPLEFGWKPSVNGLPGSYRAGVWYNTSDGDDLYLNEDHLPLASNGGTPLQHDSRRGAWITFQQQITGVAGGKGASVFLNYTAADHATSATNNQFAVGMEYKGIFDRPNDFIGAAFGGSHANGYAAKNQRLFNALNPGNEGVIKDGYERVAEVFYSWSPIPSIAIRPNLQYIKDPGGSKQNDDAFVLGLKTSVAF